ncbi:hypothetical protein KM043_004162 [Ampulex compressa]|nr:hypothetical protein KM043_004162 [Ampulex compressa]
MTVRRSSRNLGSIRDDRDPSAVVSHPLSDSWTNRLRCNITEIVNFPPRPCPMFRRGPFYLPTMHGYQRKYNPEIFPRGQEQRNSPRSVQLCIVDRIEAGNDDGSSEESR